MTTEEKLKNFLDTSMEDARNQSETMINEYTAALDKIFEEHKDEAYRKMALRLRTEKDRINREKNKELALKQIEIKHAITSTSEKLTNMIFAEVCDMLKNYSQTPAYKQLLVRQISEASAFACGVAMTVYIDPSDEPLIPFLEQTTGVKVSLSRYPLMGGTRIILQNRNILIDNSFEKKLEEAKDSFTLDRKQRC